jgi:hypothetical protein
MQKMFHVKHLQGGNATHPVRSLQYFNDPHTPDSYIQKYAYLPALGSTNSAITFRAIGLLSKMWPAGPANSDYFSAS